jgi:hypothetical protein
MNERMGTSERVLSQTQTESGFYSFFSRDREITLRISISRVVVSSLALIGLYFVIHSMVEPTTKRLTWETGSVHQTVGSTFSGVSSCACNCSGVEASASSTPTTPLPSQSTLPKAPSPSSVSSPSYSPIPSLPRINHTRRHAILVGGQVRGMPICLNQRLERLLRQPGIQIDVFAHLGPTPLVLIPASFSGNQSGYDSEAVQWLRGIAVRVVFEDLDFSDVNLVNMPQDARNVIPSWPFACQYADNPTPNVIASFYRRWRLLQMAEAEEQAGGFTYASFTLLRPDTCPCLSDIIDLDALFPSNGVELQPIKVFTAHPPSGATDSVEINFVYTPDNMGPNDHKRYLDAQIDDGDAMGPRDVMAWFLSVFPYSEVLSGQLHLRYHPETADKNALIYGLEKKALETKKSQALHVIRSPWLRYCIMRLYGECDVGCSLDKAWGSRPHGST